MVTPYSKMITDTVFYAKGDPVTLDEVKRSLVEHDGYPADIIVSEVG